LNLYYLFARCSNVTLGGAYDGGGTSLLGLQGHMICCSER